MLSVRPSDSGAIRLSSSWHGLQHTIITRSQVAPARLDAEGDPLVRGPGLALELVDDARVEAHVPAPELAVRTGAREQEVAVGCEQHLRDNSRPDDSPHPRLSETTTCTAVIPSGVPLGEALEQCCWICDGQLSLSKHTLGCSVYGL